jgi:hypothetical protein
MNIKKEYHEIYNLFVSTLILSKFFILFNFYNYLANIFLFENKIKKNKVVKVDMKQFIV